MSGSGHLADTGPVLNPHDTTRVPGASSSGSAVLVCILPNNYLAETDQSDGMHPTCPNPKCNDKCAGMYIT